MSETRENSERCENARTESAQIGAQFFQRPDTVEELRAGQVLYLLSDGEFWKLGQTRNIVNRVDAIQCGNPRCVSIIRLWRCTLDEARRTECRARLKWAHLKTGTTRHEWYRPSEEMFLWLEHTSEQFGSIYTLKDCAKALNLRR